MRGTLAVIVFCFLIGTPPAVARTCQDGLIPSNVGGDANSAIVAYLDGLSGTVLFADDETEGSYCFLNSWYQERMSSRRFSSRMLAILIIVLGASLPLVTILDGVFTNQKFWVAFIGAAIVVGQGFAQTFQYEEGWRSYTVAKLELESAHRDWQRSIVDAAIANDGLEIAQRATEKFSNRVSAIVMKETTGFFDTVAESMRDLTSNASNASDLEQ